MNRIPILRAICGLVLGALVATSHAQIDYIQNGGFEQPPFGGPGDGYVTFYPDKAPIPGWTVLSGTVDIVRLGGNQWLDLNGNDSGEVEQRIVGALGMVTLSFTSKSASPSYQAGVFWNEQSLGIIQHATLEPALTSYSVTATGNDLLRFKSLTTGVGGVYLDGITVTTCNTGAPRFVAEPESVSAVPGQNVVLSAAVSGECPMGFQWYKNGVAIPEGTGSSLTFAGAQGADAGDYHLEVTNALGTTKSATVALRIVLSGNVECYRGAPRLTREPASVVAVPGQTVTLDVGVSGECPMAFQWFHDRESISGADGATLTVANLQPLNEGDYFVEITNGQGVTRSAEARLEVSVLRVYSDGEPLVSSTAVTGATRAVITMTSEYVNGSIFYTTDGSAPTFGSTRYSGPVTLTATTTLRAVAYNSTFSEPAERGPYEIVIVPGRTLITGSNGQGTIVRTPDRELYLPGAQVTLSATPAAGWRLKEWRRDATGTAAIVQVMMDRDRNVVAVFDPTGPLPGTEYDLRATTVGGGTVLTSHCRWHDAEQKWICEEFPYQAGELVEVRAIPDEGWQFMHWKGDASGSEPTISIMMDESKQVEAVFGTTLQVTAAGPGTVRPVGEQSRYAFGSSVLILGDPHPGNFVVAWGSAASGSVNPLVFVVDRPNPLISCAFGSIPPGKLALDVRVSGTGLVRLNPARNVFDPGETVQITAVLMPELCQAFQGWSGDVNDPAFSVPLTMDTGKQVTAMFVDGFKLDVAVEGRGRVRRQPELACYPPGQEVVVSVSPESGWQFTGWTGDESSTQNPATIVLDRNKAIKARIAARPGTLLWATPTSGEVYSSPAIAEDGTVYVVSAYGTLQALDGSSGGERWEAEIGGGGLSSSPAVGADGTVYVGSGQGWLYSLDAATGARRWQFFGVNTQYFASISPNAVYSGTAYTPAIGADGTVYFSYSAYASWPGGATHEFGEVCALDGETGAVRWKSAAGWGHAPALGANGMVYISGIALDGRTGALLWRSTSGWDAAAIGADGNLYAGSGSKLYSLDGATGDVRWESIIGADGYSAPVIAADGSLYVNWYVNHWEGGVHLYKGALTSLDGATGAKRWEFATGVPASSPALAADGTVYVTSPPDATMYALDAATGTKKWGASIGVAGNLGASSPVIAADGTVYVGSPYAPGGTLYAIAGAAPSADSPWPMFQKNPQHTGRAEPPPPNQAPAITSLLDATVQELSVLELQATAVDPGPPNQQLTWSLVAAPAWATIGPANGRITLSPAAEQGPGVHTLTVKVTDNGVPPLSDEKSFRVTVLDPIRTLVSTPNPAQPGVPAEEWNLFAAPGSAGRPGILEYLYGSGNFTRTPDTRDVVWRVDPGPGGQAELLAIYSVAGQALRTAKPDGSGVSDAIVSGPAGGPETPTRTGVTAPFIPAANPFHWAADGFQGSRWFSGPWLNAADGDRDHMVTFLVSGYLSEPGDDGTFTAFESPVYVIAFEDTAEGDYDFNDLVVELHGLRPGPRNEAPSFAPVADHVIGPGEWVEATLSGSDPDVPANVLTYELVSGPAGAVVEGNVFRWQPAMADANQTHQVTVRVTDDGEPPLSATTSFNVTVGRDMMWQTLASGTGIALWGVEWGAGQFVAVGNGGKILTSPDGQAWTEQSSPTTQVLWGIKHGAGRFVAVGSGGVLVTSTDGLAWEPVVSGVTAALSDVAYGAGRFVVVGASGLILSSESGTGDWTPHSVATTKNFQDVSYAGGHFLASGTQGLVATSPDGLVWMIADAGAKASTPGSGYGFGRWWVGGAGGALFSSIDQVQWVAETSGVTTHITGFGNGHGRLLAVGGAGLDQGFVLSSRDGRTWERAHTGPIPAMYDIAFSGESWVAVGEGGGVVRSTRLLPPWAVEVTVAGLGQVRRTPDSALYPEAAAVTLEAVPADGWVFAGWTGDLTGAANPAQVVVTGDQGISATFTAVNRPPALAEVADRTVTEGEAVDLSVQATDPDLPPQQLAYALVRGPAGATLDPATGAFHWGTGEGDGGQEHTVEVRVSDNGAPPLSASRTFRVSVTEVNTAPALVVLDDRSVPEQQELRFTVMGTDADLPGQKLTYTLGPGAPDGAAIGAATGQFTWTPTEAQGPGEYPVTVRVTDDGTPPLSADRMFTVTVTELNAAPSLAAVPDRSQMEGVTLAFDAEAMDSDLPANRLSFVLIGAPDGAALDPGNGHFTWTPTEAQGPGEYSMTVRVTDTGTPSLSGERSFTVTVTEANMAPALAELADRSLDELHELRFVAAATDADLPPQALKFTLDPGAPGGATIDEATGAFAWTPTEVQGPGTYPITVSVTDRGTPPLSASRTFSVTVAEVNTAPVIQPSATPPAAEGREWSLAMAVADSDRPANRLEWSLVEGPAGMSVDPLTGVLRWTPGEADGGKAFEVKLRVTDDGTPSLSADAALTLTVDEVNSPPALGELTDRQVGELTELEVTASATDEDVPAQQLTFALVDPPPTASIEPNTGRFRWTPSEAQGPGTYTITVKAMDNGNPVASATRSFAVRVDEVNTAPVLRTVASEAIDEGTAWSADASAMDTDQPPNVLTYSLVGPPAGMRIDPASGRVEWTPTETQGPMSYPVTVRVFDNGDPARSDTRTFDLTVREVNQPPRWIAAPGTLSVDEEKPLVTSFQTVDDDWPANTLRYSLEGAPEGAAINPDTGEFRWTPSEAQGPSQPTLTVRATDNGEPPRQITANLVVTVNEINTAPRLAEIPDRTVNLGETVSFKAVATDGDQPANALTFTLVAPPAGATLDPVEGLFTWSPDATQMGPHDFTLEVADNGSPALRHSETFRLTVVHTIEVTWEAVNGEFVLRIPTLSGRTYRVEYQDNTLGGLWQVLVDNLTGNGATKSVADPISALVKGRFYRVVESAGIR